MLEHRPRHWASISPALGQRVCLPPIPVADPRGGGGMGVCPLRKKSSLYLGFLYDFVTYWVRNTAQYALDCMTNRLEIKNFLGERAPRPIYSKMFFSSNFKTPPHWKAGSAPVSGLTYITWHVSLSACRLCLLQTLLTWGQSSMRLLHSGHMIALHVTWHGIYQRAARSIPKVNTRPLVGDNTGKKNTKINMSPLLLLPLQRGEGGGGIERGLHANKCLEGREPQLQACLSIKIQIFVLKLDKYEQFSATWSCVSQ